MARCNCHIGLRETYLDKGALLADITDPNALHDLEHFASDIVLLSPKMAVIRTDITSGVWKAAIMKGMQENPNSCILKLRWKPSVQGGRPWVTPDATAKQIQAVRAQAGVARQ